MNERKTLTFKDIEKLAESNLEILLKKGYHPKRYYGIYKYDENEIRVYLPQHKSEEELIDLTILHECVHALEGKRGFREELSVKELDKTAKRIAERTLKERPEISDLIKKTFNINY